MSRVGASIIGGNFTGNARGANAIDIQVLRGDPADATLVASGENAVLFGTSGKASGLNSVAVGNSPSASGEASVAVGASTIATGDDSVALGTEAQALAAAAVAVGLQVIAGAANAMAFGVAADAEGARSLALGYGAETSAADEVVIAGATIYLQVSGVKKKIWNETNDGTGTGLDADLLDGSHAAAFASSSHNHDSDYVNVSGDTMTGDLILAQGGKKLKGTSNTGTVKPLIYLDSGTHETRIVDCASGGIRFMNESESATFLFLDASGLLTLPGPVAANYYSNNISNTSLAVTAVQQGYPRTTIRANIPDDPGSNYQVALKVGTATPADGRYGLYVDSITGTSPLYAIYTNAGTNHFGDDVELADAKNIVVNTTTGTKIGTGTSQKLGFWNATPIVQPTTGVGAATLTGGGGATVTDTDTFDGYTLKQVVKALRNTGLLA